jgi:hypothetical protein
MENFSGPAKARCALMFGQQTARQQTVCEKRNDCSRQGRAAAIFPISVPFYTLKTLSTV